MIVYKHVKDRDSYKVSFVIYQGKFSLGSCIISINVKDKLGSVPCPARALDLLDDDRSVGIVIVTMLVNSWFQHIAFTAFHSSFSSFLFV